MSDEYPLFPSLPEAGAEEAQALIDQFKKGEIHFLVNFGVLTTGFDAPKTECIAICRPTTSAVLYEQIVGRGMRGPEFGGTETCRVIDFADNIHRLGGQMAYTRFQDFWCDESMEEITNYQEEVALQI